ncbi:PAS domain-containing sensor histidine kinase [Leptospira gomenensis]|uniref:histidine kinase n=1 Tax=Leptospira gomenensis TaxID=2484974 RepID=A0A5F1YEK0_9LEPT|nr:HAMP domain-containing sensor histidine kinase [Leptospira gomenensis]TGK37525.1 PAS domain-containing sensor histidine kinase [Leptospira gomenensis]TGK39469.1 PAS domain-containing sensor histidine kinase [Leptospira gomenensis]TGK43109.1 PAS domain-containing sensor histidine kinase [Leptospira gomenensis]TGK55062.1 PAS domain-containing sensor histidine kinase [Leptospira gomenensis]
MSYNFFELSPVPGCILDPSFRIKRANSSFCKSFGFSKEGLEVGTTYWGEVFEFSGAAPDFSDPSLWPEPAVADPPSYTISVRKSGFSSREYSVFFAFDFENMQILAYLESGRISEFSKVSRSARTMRSYENGNDPEKPADSWVQKQKLEAIGTLSAGVAHEINNPLMGVINYAELVFNGIESGNPLRKYAGIILQESNRISEIVKDMLTFTRLEKEEARLHDLTAIFCSTFGLLKNGFRKSGIEVVVPPLDVPVYAVCSAGRLRQVYLNLLTNAKDALDLQTDPTKPKLLTLEWIPLKKKGRPFLRTVVEDTGIGIPEENRHKLFDPFYTTKEIGKGTGLGLTVSYNLVLEMGGELSFQSENGTTRFYVDLPESF